MGLPEQKIPDEFETSEVLDADAEVIELPVRITEQVEKAREILRANLLAYHSNGETAGAPLYPIDV